MSYASQSGRARTEARNPQAFSVCQRCGIWYNFVDLAWQFDYRGSTLQNTRLLVCHSCLDTPQEQLRAIDLPADPLPVPFSIIEPFIADETEGPTTPFGPPTGLEGYAISPSQNGVAYGTPVPALSITANGTTTISVTCSRPHGLVTNDQISVQGITNRHASGFFSIIATTGTAFTYTTFAPIPAAALITPTTLILTALVGLPYGVTSIPQVGP